MKDGNITLHHFTDGDVDMAVVVPAERWREIGEAVMATSAQI